MVISQLAYPDVKLLNKERKVKDRGAKEKVRGEQNLKMMLFLLKKKTVLKNLLTKLFVGTAKKSCVKSLLGQSISSLPHHHTTLA